MLDHQNMSNTFEKPVLLLSLPRENELDSRGQLTSGLPEFELVEYESFDSDLTIFERKDLKQANWSESELLEIEQAESEWDKFERKDLKQANWSDSELMEIEQAESEWDKFERKDLKQANWSDSELMEIEQAESEWDKFERKDLKQANWSDSELMEIEQAESEWEELEQTDDDALEFNRQETVQKEFSRGDEIFFNDRLIASDCCGTSNYSVIPAPSNQSLVSVNFNSDNLWYFSSKSKLEDCEKNDLLDRVIINNQPELKDQEENFQDSLSSSFSSKSKNRSQKRIAGLINKLQMAFLLALAIELFLYFPVLWSGMADFSMRFHAWISILTVGFGLFLGRVLPITSAVSFIALLSYKEICVCGGITNGDYLIPVIVLLFFVYAQFFLFNLMRGIMFFRQTC